MHAEYVYHKQHDIMGRTRPPPIQTGINAKILKISPEWRRILIDEFFLYLFAEFELYPFNSFRENRC